MKTYLTHKTEVEGLIDVSETIKTVEKIAASSIHLLKKEVINLNLYTSKIESMLSRLSLYYNKNDHPLLEKKGGIGKALVILTSEKGLVGGLWHIIINDFLNNAEQYPFIIIVGTKGASYLKEENMQIKKSFSHVSEVPAKEEINEVTSYLFDEFKKGTFSQVDLLYPHFISLADQQPFLVPFLPFEFVASKERENSMGLPIFEPSKIDVFNHLVEKYISVFFYKIVMETKLSELSARTVAMEHASARTEDLIKKVTFKYTKERRRVITQKQLESFVAHKGI